MQRVAVAWQQADRRRRAVEDYSQPLGAADDDEASAWLPRTPAAARRHPATSITLIDNTGRRAGRSMQSPAAAGGHCTAPTDACSAVLRRPPLCMLLVVRRGALPHAAAAAAAA